MVVPASAHDDGGASFDGLVAGVAVRVTGFDFDGNERRGVSARVVRDGAEHTVSLRDVTLADRSAPTAGRIIAAYRGWLGIQ
jgi:hypothetical protein